MKLNRYWAIASQSVELEERPVQIDGQLAQADGQPVEISRWGWSANSRDEAAKVARARAAQAAARLATQPAAQAAAPASAQEATRAMAQQIADSEAPPREQILKEFSVSNSAGSDTRPAASSSQPAPDAVSSAQPAPNAAMPAGPSPIAATPYAALLRSPEGYLVLATESMIVLDLDVPGVDVSATEELGFINMVFGGTALTRGAEDRPRAELEAPARSRIESFARLNDAWCTRLYRTLTGLRVIVAGAQGTRAGGPQAQMVLRALGADPQDIAETNRRGHYRVRLTAMPERLGMGEPPAQWPFTDPSFDQYQEGLAEEANVWLEDYTAESKLACAAQFIAEFGRPLSEIAGPDVHLVELHDRLANASESYPLA